MSDSHKDISGAEALDKIKEIVGHSRTCQMLTNLTHRPICSRPMGVQKMDEQGRMRFLSHKSSKKNVEISASNEVQLEFINDSDLEYLSLYGTAEIYRDQKEIDELYSKFADNWFDGKEDPNITIIRFTPVEGRYSDTKHGKFAQYVAMISGAITGKNGSDGIEGQISI
ncbi:MAG: pyridoxamine 5'-phosphate oxidase family protein [Bacteroidota bacterium]